MIAINEILAGRQGLAGLQQLLYAPAGRQLLRRELAAILVDANQLGQCRLEYADFKPGHQLTGYFQVGLHRQCSERLDTRFVSVTWSLAKREEKNSRATQLTAIHEDALEHGALAPFRQLWYEAVDSAMVIQVFPCDLQFPQLIRVSTHPYAEQMLTIYDCCRRSGAAEGRELHLQTIDVVRYCPGQRHLLRYTLASDATQLVFFAKLCQGEESQCAFRLTMRLAAWLAAQHADLRAHHPRAHLAADSMLLYPALQGPTLAVHLRRPGQITHRYLEKLGDSLFVLHAAPPLLSNDLACQTFANEMHTVARMTEHITTLWPKAGERVAALLDHIQTLHRDLPQEAPTFVHGGYEAKHIWVTPEGLRLTNFDHCTLADPALDIGRFLADLRWWSFVYAYPSVEPFQSAFLSGYPQLAASARLQRARIYEVLFMLKQTVQRSSGFSANWKAITDQLLGQAELAAKSARHADR